MVLDVFSRNVTMAATERHVSVGMGCVFDVQESTKAETKRSPFSHNTPPLPPLPRNQLKTPTTRIATVPLRQGRARTSRASGEGGNREGENGEGVQGRDKTPRPP